MGTHLGRGGGCPGLDGILKACNIGAVVIVRNRLEQEGHARDGGHEAWLLIDGPPHDDHSASQLLVSVHNLLVPCCGVEADGVLTRPDEDVLILVRVSVIAVGVVRTREGKEA